MANYNSLFTGAEIDQGVDAALSPDTAPASGSTALITSGGVYNATAVQLVDKTASFNFTATEAGKIVNASSSSAIVGTIRPDSALNLPIGAMLVMRRVGTGAVSFAAGAGVTTQAGNGLSITAQYRYGSAIKMAANLWSVICS